MVYCTICCRDDRAVIEGIINNTSLREIARMFGLSKTSVHRHKARHMAATNGSNGAASNGANDGGNPDSQVARYRAFVERFKGGRGFSMTEVATWGYSPEELNIFVRVAIQRGELSRGGEAGQNTSGTVRR